jgi:hypothetical protein
VNVPAIVRVANRVPPVALLPTPLCQPHDTNPTPVRPNSKEVAPTKVEAPEMSTGVDQEAALAVLTIENVNGTRRNVIAAARRTAATWVTPRAARSC